MPSLDSLISGLALLPGALDSPSDGSSAPFKTGLYSMSGPAKMLEGGPAPYNTINARAASVSRLKGHCTKKQGTCCDSLCTGGALGEYIVNMTEVRRRP